MAITGKQMMKWMGSALSVAILATSVPSHAENGSQSKLPFTEDQRGAMEDFVRDFILNNPEVLMESINLMHEKERQQKDDEAKAALKESYSYFYQDPSVPEAGNPKGDVTVIEFFDYNCGYCKRAFDVVKQTIESDKNVRIRFIEFPILSEQSTEAAKWSLSAARQGKYWEFHTQMMNSPAPKNEENMTRMAKEAGLDIERLKKDAASPEIEAELAKNRELTQKLGISGTPGFIVGDQILRGFVEYEGFKTIVEDERKKAKN